MSNANTVSDREAHTQHSDLLKHDAHVVITTPILLFITDSVHYITNSFNCYNYILPYCMSCAIR